MTEKPRASLAVRALVEIVIIAVAVVIGLQVRDGLTRRAVDPASETADAAGATETSEGDRAGSSPLDQVGMREGGTPLRSQPNWTPPTKVVVLDMWPGRTGELARAAPDLDVVVVADHEQALAEVGDADALLGVLTPPLLEAGGNLRWVQLASAGVESYLAMPGMSESEFVFTNAQRIFAPGGAEHVLGLVLSLARRIPLSLELQNRAEWNAPAVTGPSAYVGDGSELPEMRGRTMVIAGLGGIGTETARIAHGIGMRVNATRNSSRDGPDFVDYVGLSDELIDLVREADVVVNTLPLTAATERIFDEEMFRAMKPGAYFVNVGRGRTVDTAALLRALQDGHLGGAGLDVTDPEPLPPEHELWRTPNVIITPHVGGDSDRHMERMYVLFEENLRRFAAGDALLSVVGRRRGY